MIFVLAVGAGHSDDVFGGEVGRAETFDDISTPHLCLFGDRSHFHIDHHLGKHCDK